MLRASCFPSDNVRKSLLPVFSNNIPPFSSAKCFRFVFFLPHRFLCEFYFCVIFILDFKSRFWVPVHSIGFCFLVLFAISILALPISFAFKYTHIHQKPTKHTHTRISRVLNVKMQANFIRLFELRQINGVLSKSHVLTANESSAYIRRIQFNFPQYLFD